MAPKGESNSDKPRLPSVNPNLYFIVGIEATHVPNKRLEDANRNPIANAGLNFIKEEKLLRIRIPKFIVSKMEYGKYYQEFIYSKILLSTLY